MFILKIFKKILFWFLGVFALLATGYYIVGKFVLHLSSPFINIVDKLLFVLGFILNFVAQHIFAILIVVAFIILLNLTYKFIVYINIGDKE